MRTSVALALACLVLSPSQSSAHRLDEYLQAARVSLAAQGVLLELDLTPGVNIAPAIVPLLDANGDGTIAPAEAREYGLLVLREVTLQLDTRPLTVELTRAEVPAIRELLDGVGTIRLRAAATTPVPTGRRQLLFRNDHRPASSVYLANALLPEDRYTSVAAQARDPLQRELRVDYDVRSALSLRLFWTLAAAAVVVLAALRNTS